MVLSERESERGPDIVDKHLSLHLLKKHVKSRMCSSSHDRAEAQHRMD